MQLHWLSTTLSNCRFSSMPANAAYTAGGVSVEEPGGSDDTIVALSSGAGRSAVAVIRISGPQADAALLAMLKPGSRLPEARVAALRSLYDPSTQDLLDRALVLRFPAPASFTGETVVELQGHGGPAVVRALLSALTKLPGLRLAEAGEFTRQAFMGGKLDLTEVEGIADLLAAETAAQHRQALQQTGGVHKQRYEAWRRTLLNCLAHVEAVIDFGDDNDIDSGVAAEVLPAAVTLRQELEGHLKNGKRGELVRDGVRVALVGPPNAGKSTLLNRLAGRDAAIVSPIPGTTRDALEVVLELGGHKVILTDTAGVRDTEDAVEAEGVSRAKQAVLDADIVVAVADVAAPEHDSRLLQWARALVPGPAGDPEVVVQDAAATNANGNGRQPQQRLSAGWSTEEFAADLGPSNATTSIDAEEDSGQKPVLLVFNKLDLAFDQPRQIQSPASEENGAAGAETVRWLQQRLQKTAGSCGSHVDAATTAVGGAGSATATVYRPEAVEAGCPQGIARVLGISASTGQGLDLLEAALETEVAAVTGRSGSGEGHMITRLRHRQHVEECVLALQGYERVHDQLELASEELRYAARALGKVTGAIDIEHVLDAIFSEFCVGK